jgi:hypothetical protein
MSNVSIRQPYSRIVIWDEFDSLMEELLGDKWISGKHHYLTTKEMEIVLNTLQLLKSKIVE